MAMARSLAPLFLLLSLLASAATAARTVGGGVQDACSKTQFPKMCVDSLSALPESQKASTRRLAELLVNIAAERGSGMATFVHGKYNGAKDTTMFKCYDSCSDDVEEAVAHLNGLIREPTDAKFLELKSWLSSTLGGTSTCEDACKDLPKTNDKEDVVNFSIDFERLLRVALDLINEASGSMSADIALPPSDAAAPIGGAAGSPAEAPASESEGGASVAPAAAADAPAPSSSGSSSAPAPSASDKSAGAPAPSSDSSGAPAQSPAGDSDSDDDDNDDGSA
ncbi:hypothetical protein U9M48_012297 [Paspalum notatum var. saurae]|uniref:Pectinesterase inhibitor domain-containing protein n=1 Tax=Paspalum notatum var. saurae TaxID=547442 RepID=A0AAQ3WIE5_PASNO